jgi:hypothetical protein
MSFLTKAFSKVTFESVGFIHSSNSKPSNYLNYGGEVNFFQRKKFTEDATYSEYNVNIFRITNIFLICIN